MAAFAQTTGFLTSLERLLEIVGDTHERETLDEITTILDTEFAKIVSDGGVDSYTQTATFKSSLIKRLINVANVTKRRSLEELIGLINTEFAKVVTDGIAGTAITTQLSRNMKWALSNWPNLTERINLYAIVDILIVEFTAVVDAS